MARKSFSEWLLAVKKLVSARCGLSLEDLPDVPLADWDAEGVSPRSAAARAVRSASEG